MKKIYNSPHCEIVQMELDVSMLESSYINIGGSGKLDARRRQPIIIDDFEELMEANDEDNPYGMN